MCVPLELRTDRDRLVLAPRQLIVAGYTGRDEAAVRQHIEELAAEGIAPPPSVPMFYPLDPALLTTGSDCAVTGDRTSGEVEPVYIRSAGQWYLGVGSDHTDRALERTDILTSKAACPKPIGPEVIPLPAAFLDGAYDEAFDQITVRSRVDGAEYQHGTLSSLRRPSDLLRQLFPEAIKHDDEADLVVFGGTVPLSTDGFRFGTSWTVALTAATGETVTHTYDTRITARR